MWVPEARQVFRVHQGCLAWMVSRDCRVLLAPRVLKDRQALLARMASLEHQGVRVARWMLDFMAAQ